MGAPAASRYGGLTPQSVSLDSVWRMGKERAQKLEAAEAYRIT